MKLLKLKVKGLPNFKEILEVEFTTKQRVSQDSAEQLQKVFSNSYAKIYANKVMSFVGINASGKTTILKVISFVLKMLSNESINNIETKDILNDLEDGESITITSYFYEGNFINKLETIIEKVVNSLDGTEKFIIADEILWTKDVGGIKTKKSLFDFCETDINEKRNQNEQYLLDDVSIMIAMNKKNSNKFSVRDMLSWTDHNMLNVLGSFPKELLTFLDPSIEYLKCTIKNKKVDIRLKFYGKKEIQLNNPGMLENYLSSGTIKGLSVFMNAIFAFIDGAYLIVDEIENHFNREIVATLIRFFMDKKVNKKGATLIFSTHYSELLDEFDRNDCIYIVRNREGIFAENLSNILSRNDIKKSEVYDSGFLIDTVPAYEAYMDLKKSIMSAE